MLREGLAVVAVPFQSAAMAVVFLNRSESFHRGLIVATPDADRELIRTHLAGIASTLVASSSETPPDNRASRRWRRTAFLVPALALPGLIFTAYLRTNPLGLPTFSDREVPLPGVEYRGDPAIPHHDRDGHLIALVEGYGRDAAALLTCPDSACENGSHVRRGAPFTKAPETDVTALSDGRITVASWEPSGGDADPWHLNLYGCDAGGCGRRPANPDPLSTARPHDIYLSAAIAARSDGGVVVAHTTHRDRGVLRSVRLALTTCPDRGCRAPTTVQLGWVPLGLHPRKGRPLSVAVAPDGTPTVAFRHEAGEVTIAACDSPRCRRPEVTTPVDGLDDYFAQVEESVQEAAGVDVVVRDDGRPAVAYREALSGAARLILCHDPACTEVTDKRLTPPGRFRPWPALTHDDEGRLLVATYDRGGASGRLLLVICDDAACTSTTTLPLAEVHRWAGPLDVTLTPDGRPQVLWADYDDFLFFEGDLRVTTCASPECR